jgi:hypothetical protein
VKPIGVANNVHDSTQWNAISHIIWPKNREHNHHGATVKAREVVGDEKGDVFVFL